jgi:hypothetical protein
VHFSYASTSSYFLNPAFVEALFPNENIFLSLGHFLLLNPFDAVLPGILALTRIHTLSCWPNHLVDVKTLFNELLLTSKHGIYRAHFLCHCHSMSAVSIGDFIKVAFPSKNIFLFLILILMETGI